MIQITKSLTAFSTRKKFLAHCVNFRHISLSLFHLLSYDIFEFLHLFYQADLMMTMKKLEIIVMLLKNLEMQLIGVVT